MELRRVVVTGMGIVCPLGSGIEPVWARLLDSRSGAKRIDDFKVDDLACKIAARIPLGDTADGDFNPDDWMDRKDQRRVDNFIVYAMAAAGQAIADSGLEFSTPEDQERSGVMIGSGIGGVGGINDTAQYLVDGDPRRISPFFVTGRIINLASGYVSMRHGLKGPNHAVATACSTGTHAIGDAARMVAFGDADVMVAGGSESPANRISVAGFSAARALSTQYNDDPERASRPFDENRDGFVLGEGSGVVVLEEYEHAKARGAKIYGEWIGYGMSGDAHHITAPPPDGNGAFRAMSAAIKRAGISPADIDYINAHGTSTPVGDGVELIAVNRLLGEDADKVLMSSTKSAIGHLLGAAGAVEVIFSLLAMRDNIAPPTLNLDTPPEDSAINLVPKVPVKREINTVLSNSFGFGGTNASLIFRRTA